MKRLALKIKEPQSADFGTTNSVCPVCRELLEAKRVLRGDDLYLVKTCLEHGTFDTVIWRGVSDFPDWFAPTEPAYCPADNNGSPACFSGGLCENHATGTCCVLTEVTSRCNLHCPVCFADAGNAGEDVPLDELTRRFSDMAARGNTFVQLSGGEPTVRGDLPEVIRAAVRCGIKTVQLNTNGVLLGQSAGYAQELAEAGLSFVFLQFDGVTDGVYEQLRGQKLLETKLAAIDSCGRAGLGVTLVPTVVPGVNDGETGAIIKFAVSKSPTVRGVHFQPVSYFGRTAKTPENADRITLPEVMRAAAEQSGGLVRLSDFRPSTCDHPRCGFHADFAVLPGGSLMRIAGKKAQDCCGSSTAHLQNREFVARRWTRSREDEKKSDCCDTGTLDGFLTRVKSHGFTLTGMAFQDAYTLETERLSRCSLHVQDSGAIRPFCANYI
ncbi:MAG: radical SAM protein [Oscillospiraceae bacterium]|nr:radical SAM protein [Oscillospiraceae bacterium]